MLESLIIKVVGLKVCNFRVSFRNGGQFSWGAIVLKTSFEMIEFWWPHWRNCRTLSVSNFFSVDFQTEIFMILNWYERRNFLAVFSYSINLVSTHWKLLLKIFRSEIGRLDIWHCRNYNSLSKLCILAS